MSAAFLAVADAFEEYEEALYEAYEEYLPLTVVDEDDEDEEPYAGEGQGEPNAE